MRLKIMKVKKEKLRIGDYVLQEDGCGAYFVIDTGKTMLHSHPYIEVLYPHGKMRKWMLQDLSNERTVCRAVDE